MSRLFFAIIGWFLDIFTCKHDKMVIVDSQICGCHLSGKSHEERLRQVSPHQQEPPC